ncbi:Imm21 family immunity protein [Streptomyces sp. NPDC059525]|uniref:Imm21 family immunity protein n=1 Tax=Streptomyces sp. NPDC059525 TaxID=3346857 RepID=UPI0036B95C94
MTLRWLETEGGPFVVVPHTWLPHWSRKVGAYDRACAVMDFVGVFALPSGAEALVLEDEPLPTAYPLSIRSSSAGATRRARMVSPTSSGQAFPPPSGRKARPALNTSGTSGAFVMFDAAYGGTEAGTLTDSAVLGLAGGPYRVDSASTDPDDLRSFRMHRFAEMA